MSTYESFIIIFCEKMNQRFHYMTISSHGQRKERIGVVVQWGQALLVRARRISGANDVQGEIESIKWIINRVGRFSIYQF
jgi:hypothetical protein